MPTPTRRDAVHSLLLSVLGSGLVTTEACNAALSEIATPAQKDGRTLVVYLSRSGNTRVIAGELKRAFTADLFQIRTATPWPEDYEEMVAWASRMRESGTPPTLAENVSGITKYNVVFLGSPIWGMTLPAPVRTFLSTHDLSGKTLVPFFTYGCCGTGSAPETIAKLAPRARILEPFSLKCDQERDTLNSVTAWLRSTRTQL
ncbi:MAG TPA: flavodoxin, partial [Bryobacteraceae bacterium]